MTQNYVNSKFFVCVFDELLANLGSNFVSKARVRVASPKRHGDGREKLGH